MPNSGEEWQVARRRKGAGRRGKIPHTACHEPGHADAVDIDRTKQRITETMAELRCADFWFEWRDRLTAVAKADSPEVGGDPAAGSDPRPEGGDRAREAPSGPLECVCYGLGSFSCCVTARYQLAMLLLILESLQIPMEWCSVYDPVFSSGEMEVLRQLGLNVLTENEEGKRAVSRPTLFYLMHCGKALYNNLLWKNWSRDALPLLTIIGNSFAGIQDRLCVCVRSGPFHARLDSWTSSMTLPSSPSSPAASANSHNPPGGKHQSPNTNTAPIWRSYRGPQR
uniref:SRR1-like domain-containing protein n=1 Tax=Oncorhynchus tshawytscha TaxID=74940 RepID=A0AAZ3R1Q6_ONCTS